MKTTSIYKGVGALALGTALTFGASFQASALPVFEVTPSVLGGPAAPGIPPNPAGTFMADQITGGSSTLVTYDSPSNTINGQGYIVFGSFLLNSNQVINSGLNTFPGYGLYATFNYNASLTGGTFGTANSTYNINTLTFALNGYQIGVGTQPTFNQATVIPGPPSGGTVTPGSGSQLIGTGSLVTGVINQDMLAGATVNTVNTYQNTPFGSTFFTAPTPFYNIAFAAITNTAQGLQSNPDVPERGRHHQHRHD